MKTLKINKPLLVKKTRKHTLNQDKNLKASLLKSQKPNILTYIKNLLPTVIKWTFLLAALIFINLRFDLYGKLVSKFTQTPYSNSVGYLAVTTLYTPANVKIVTTDGQQDLGTTPIEHYALAPGSYSLQFEAQAPFEHATYTLDVPVTVAPNSTTVVQANIGPTFKTSSYLVIYQTPAAAPILTIFTYQPDVQIYVDENVAGKAPLTLDNISTGAHKIRLAKTGLKPLTIEIDVKDKTNIHIDAKLYEYVLKLE